VGQYDATGVKKIGIQQEAMKPRKEESPVLGDAQRASIPRLLSEKLGVALHAPFDKAHAFTDALRMTSLPVTQARSRLYQLLDEAADSHEPIQITGKRSNAVLVSEDDWRSIQETLYLISIPGMRDSIRKGMAEPLAKASTKPGW
jgi:prevent-host-death family protein